MTKRVIVTGAGGFIGGHLTRELKSMGHHVLGIDRKPISEWEQPDAASKALAGFDLRMMTAHEIAEIFIQHEIEEVYALAADMGGMGFIETHKLECMLSVNISTNTMWAADIAGVGQLFYASSACVYPGYKQDSIHADVIALREEDAYPADAEDGYGWEKLFSERMARHFREETGMSVAVARYHNVYGPYGTWTGGREKAPAAICRKVAEAKASGVHEIDIWGDGTQLRSYMYVDDCVKGTIMLTDAGDVDPINLGSAECVSVNELVNYVEEIAFGEAGVLARTYQLDKPKGVAARSSDNSRILSEFVWEPHTPLIEGLRVTYDWISEQVRV